MLKRTLRRASPASVPSSPGARGARSPVRIAVVASEYNAKHVDGLLQGSLETFRETGVEARVFRVPGAFEIPVVAECLASQEAGTWAAIVCLGVIIRGETAHADLIGEAITRALMAIAVRHRLPVIHEVLLVGNKAQADVRCLDPRYNRGGEAARTALAMADLVAGLRGPSATR